MLDKLHSGEIYYPTDDSIMEVQLKCLDKLYDFNATRPSEIEKRMAIMKEMFGDIGEGTIGEDGLCYISFDPIFAQTIATDQYQVFLQMYNAGNCWVKSRTSSWFIVEGTPGLKFGWEVKAKQRDYDQLRLETSEEKLYIMHKQSYDTDAANYIEELRQGRITL